jgi:hypothetical protein
VSAFVYLVRAELTGLVKIGATKNPFERVRNLQTGSPDRLNLVATIEFPSLHHAYAAEQKLHKRFSKYRVHGEWFKPDQTLDKFIAQCSSTTQPGEFITARDLAILLRKSLTSVYRMAEKKTIAHVRGEGGLLFPRACVDHYIAARLVPSSDTKQAAA